MTFVLDIDDANKLYKFAKAFIDPNEPIGGYTLVACEIENNILTATMLSKAALCKVKFRVDGENGVCFIAPPAHRFTKQDCIVEVKDSDSETSYTTQKGTQTFKKPYYEAKVFPYNMDKEPKETLWMSSALLSKTAAAFDKYIKVDFLGERDGLYLSDNKGTKAVVMPIKPPKGEN